MMVSSTMMLLPKGDLNEKSPLALDLDHVFKAERRLEDVKTCNPDNVSELMGEMNVAANESAKYMSWIQYELLMAKKNYDKRKAILILDYLPDFLKDKGLKPNEDVREAFITKDDTAFQLRDRIDCLTAAFYMLENKLKSFVRAFNAAKSVADSRRGQATAPITRPGPNPWASQDRSRELLESEDDNGE